MGIDAPDAPNAPDATTTATMRQENEALFQNMDIAHQLEAEVGKNHGSSKGVLKVTSGNGNKRLKAKQETRVTTQASMNAEATIKQVTTQELQVEKCRIEEWKKKVMVEVGRELQIIKTGHVEAIEVQRRDFQSDLKTVREKLALVELRSETLEEELKALKTAQGNQSATKRLPKTTPVASASPTTSVSKPKEIDTSQASSNKNMDDSSTPASTTSKHHHIEKQSYAAIATLKPSQSPEQPWTQVRYKNNKQTANRAKPLLNKEQRGRRILFPRGIPG